MTENEWEENHNIERMLSFLGDKASPRKCRLLAVAFAKNVLPPGPDRDMVHAVDTAERFADGATSKSEVNRARKALTSTQPERGVRYSPLYTDHVRSVPVWYALGRNPPKAAWKCAEVCLYSKGRSYSPSGLISMSTSPHDVIAQADLLRDIFGNPFRPVAFAPGWRTASAVALADAMYQSRDFGPMPVLADALEEAGCDNPDILAHCRGDGPHVRGCWVVDLVLGKS